MSYRNLILVVLWSAASWLMGVAQTDAQAPGTAAPESAQRNAPAPAVSVGPFANAPVEPEEEQPEWSTAQPIVPAIVGGYGSSLAFGTEMARSNNIRGALTAQTTYDDNAYLNANHPISNATYSIFPQIGLDQSRPRVRWIMNYAGGFTFNQRLSSQSQTSQDFNFDVRYRVSPHVTVRATEVFAFTTGLFGPVNGLNGSVPGVATGSNPFVITPLSNQVSNVTRGEIAYHFSAADVVGASGGYNLNNYRDVPVGLTLLDTRSENAAAYYMHRVTTSNWLGASYVFEHLGFTPGDQATNAHSMIAFDSFTLKPNMTLSLFAGPQYSNNTFLPVLNSTTLLTQNKWSVAAGANYSWQGAHTSASVEFSRKIADGGGVLGSVELMSASGALRHQLTRRWAVLLSGAYATNDALTTSASTGTPNTKFWSGTFDITRQLGESFFVQVGYSRQAQNSLSTAAFNGDTNHNVVIASLSYQFARPWGR